MTTSFERTANDPNFRASNLFTIQHLSVLEPKYTQKHTPHPAKRYSSPIQAGHGGARCPSCKGSWVWLEGSLEPRWEAQSSRGLIIRLSCFHSSCCYNPHRLTPPQAAAGGSGPGKTKRDRGRSQALPSRTFRTAGEVDKPRPVWSGPEAGLEQDGDTM